MTYYAWAAVGRESGKLLRDLKGHLSIYRSYIGAHLDCPNYGEVRKVRITVTNEKVLKARMR